MGLEDLSGERRPRIQSLHPGWRSGGRGRVREAPGHRRLHQRPVGGPGAASVPRASSLCRAHVNRGSPLSRKVGSQRQRAPGSQRLSDPRAMEGPWDPPPRRGSGQLREQAQSNLASGARARAVLGACRGTRVDRKQDACWGQGRVPMPGWAGPRSRLPFLEPANSLGWRKPPRHSPRGGGEGRSGAME